MNLQIVAIEPAFERQGTSRRHERLTERLSGSEHLTLHEEHVEVAVVVVVEQADARRHDLGVVELAGHAVEVHEVQAGIGCPIREPFLCRILRRIDRSSGHAARFQYFDSLRATARSSNIAHRPARMSPSLTVHGAAAR